MKAFHSMLEKRWLSASSLVCVGLDTDYQRIPKAVKESVSTRSDAVGSSIAVFNREIIDATAEFVCCYKPQIAYYAAEGEAGLEALRLTIDYIHTQYPDIPVILDAKRSDIGKTAEKYVIEIFDIYGADAATLNPFLGREACSPFLERKEKGLFFLCHTSNPGAGEFQELLVRRDRGPASVENQVSQFLPLYEVIAHNISNEWNDYGNCGLVVGATYPDQMASVRQIVGDMPLLIPGIGTQGGDIESTVKAAKDSRGLGMIVSSSRSIIYASSEADFALTAREKTINLRDAINLYR